MEWSRPHSLQNILLPDSTGEQRSTKSMFSLVCDPEKMQAACLLALVG